MPDRVSLSLWIRNYNAQNMLRHFEQLLRVFPFSKLRPGVAGVRVYALEFVEPPLFERVYPGAVDTETLIDVFREFEHGDCAYMVDGYWELLQFENDWRLAPARVLLACFGPEFDNDMGDHLRIEAGFETDFLPDPELPGSDRAARANLQSVVRLAKEIEGALPVQRRQLWSESGENLAQRLDEAVWLL